jgi:hypothetical protein
MLRSVGVLQAIKKLIVTGEWMAPHIFILTPTGFEENKTNLDCMDGGRQLLLTADPDGDGDQSLVMGNIGEDFNHCIRYAGQ